MPPAPARLNLSSAVSNDSHSTPRDEDRGLHRPIRAVVSCWRGSIWTRSVLAREAIADTTALQWRLPDLVLWPKESSSVQFDAAGGNERAESPALGEMRSYCTAKSMAKRLSKAAAAPTNSLAAPTRAPRRDLGLGEPCIRSAWLHNLTAFLAKRNKIPRGVVSVG